MGYHNVRLLRFVVELDGLTTIFLPAEGDSLWGRYMD